ncbi:MAG: helix-turn-helix domain-containing protein, partial [Treponemataceae bacterium]|nr:helix-turn-helix domain-containing protein [Treponemataceae bacterium]
MKKYKDVRTILSELGETLKLYRVSLNLSQADIEEKSGVSKRSISRLEQG